MDDWVSELAAVLGVDPLTAEDIPELLSTARDVAHGVERRVTPLASFLMGAAVQSRVSAGATRAEATAEVLGLVRACIPQAPV